MKQDKQQAHNDLPRFNALVEQVRSKKNTVHCNNRSKHKGDTQTNEQQQQDTPVVI